MRSTRLTDRSLVALACATILLGITSARADTIYAGNDDGTIQKISPAGVVGNFVTLPGGAAFGGVTGMAFDDQGNLYASDSGNAIGNASSYKITPDGTISEFATGMTLPEAAKVLQISTTTADRYWAYAKAWLLRDMTAEESKM